jgi:DNA polymerase-3 subunit beta
MKISVTQENLSKALTTVSRLANSRVSLPILNNIFLRAESNRLTLSSTNMDIAIIQNIGAKVEKEGVAVIPAKLITDFVSNLPKTNVDIELVDDKLYIQSGNYKSIINTINADDFPEIPEIKKATKISIDSKILKRAIAQTAPICSVDVTRPILTGIYFYTEKDQIFLVATDGYRLAEKKIMADKQELKAIVPASALLNVNQSLTDDMEDINILISSEQISFNLGNIEITSRLIAGNFINYQGLIPTKTECEIVVDKSEFVRIVKISELFARESADSITLKADKEKQLVTIKSVASELGENSSEIEADISSDGEITLNAKYLLEALNDLDSEKVWFGFSGKLAPALIKGVEVDDYQHIIMPIKS